MWNLSQFVRNIRDIKLSLIDNRNTMSKKEAFNKKIAKKSIYFSKNLEKNQIIKKRDLIALRPRLKGFSPIDYEKIIGKRVKRSVKKETIIEKNKIR